MKTIRYGIFIALLSLAMACNSHNADNPSNSAMDQNNTDTMTPDSNAFNTPPQTTINGKGHRHNQEFI